jgi:uncharacterized membrane protein (UPF0127 family)
MKKRLNMVNVVIKYNSKMVSVKNVKKLSEFGKGIGLMFHKREACPAMLFEFKKPTRMMIHSLFVFFKFEAVWLDDKNRIVDKKLVKPFRLAVSSEKSFYKLLEIPVNRYYKKEIEILFKNM